LALRGTADRRARFSLKKAHSLQAAKMAVTMDRGMDQDVRQAA
jgi:hypothetical protein